MAPHSSNNNLIKSLTLINNNIVAATFNNFKEILGGNLVRQHKTIKFDIKGEQTTTLYKVYQNRLNRLK